tara:strand:+ start:209 stop:382 length:174 start_codon:yes stop_codon:yes gene_type:complete
MKNNNYVTSLASFLYEKLTDYQSDPKVKKNMPMRWPSGIFFTKSNIQQWIEEHDEEQ